MISPITIQILQIIITCLLFYYLSYHSSIKALEQHEKNIKIREDKEKEEKKLKDALDKVQERRNRITDDYK